MSSIVVAPSGKLFATIARVIFHADMAGKPSVARLSGGLVISYKPGISLAIGRAGISPSADEVAAFARAVEQAQYVLDAASRKDVTATIDGAVWGAVAWSAPRHKTEVRGVAG